MKVGLKLVLKDDLVENFKKLIEALFKKGTGFQHRSVAEAMGRYYYGEIGRGKRK